MSKNKKLGAVQGEVNSSYFPPQQEEEPQYVSTGGAMPVSGVVGTPVSPNNIFAKKPMSFGTSELSRPVVAYDTTKDLEANLAGEGAPSVPNIISATNTPTQRAMRAEAQNVVPVVDPESSSSGMDALRSLYTSPEDELKERRASRTRQRIMALGDALRHIGNIYNTVNYAPSQQFNDPVGEERKRYQEERALRDANNYKYMTYQQAKAAQDAKMKQLEAQTKYQNESLKIRQAEHDRLVGAQKLAERKQQAYENIKKEEMELKQKLADHKISVEDYNAESRRLQAQAAWLRASNGGSGSSPNGFDTYITYEPNQYDENGKLLKKGTQHTSRVPKKPAAKNNLNLTGAKDNKANDPKNLSLKK